MLAPMFSKALTVSPSRSRFIVSLPNEEKVVKPPRMPKKTSARVSGKLGEQTDHETTDQVDRQRAVGKINALAGGLRPRAEQIAGDRSQRAAEGNEGDVEE